MKTPHTPGQHNEPHGGTWTVADYSEEQCEIVSEGMVHVAFCNESPKGRANARLIAAAPQLLTMCEIAMDFILSDGYRETSFPVADLRAIIDKARTP